MIHSKKLMGFFVLLLALIVAGCSDSGGTGSDGGSGSGSEQLLSIGTASIGGAYYPVGQAISTLITKYVDGVSVTPEVTGGSVENPRLTDTGDVEMSLTNANLAHFAVNGEDPYDKKLNISAIAPLHPSVLHIVAKADSPINTIEDLKGKRVAVGPAGGGSAEMLGALLGAVGMSLDEINATYISYADGFTQLSDGNVDVALALAGYPASAVMEASTTTNIKFVKIDDAMMEKAVSEFPYYSKVVIPKDVYKLDEDVTAIGVNNLWIVNNDLDETLVYNITKAVFDHMDEFQEANANAKQINLDQVKEVSIPIHPGAKKYFDEIGK